MRRQMKKKIVIVVISLFIAISLASCSLNTTKTIDPKNTTTIAVDEEKTIDMSSLVNAIYSSVYEKIESDLYDQIYQELMKKYGDGTIDAETIQKQVYDVVSGPGQANICVISFSDTDGEAVAKVMGSGVIYEKVDNSEGATAKYRYYFITNHHVVSGYTSYTANFSDSTAIPAILVGSDETTDIAVLYFDTDRTFQVAELGDSDSLKVGQFVLAIGTPKNQTLFGSVNFGVVGGLNRNLLDSTGVVNKITTFIQHDAAINAGNSGGGLFTLDGKVVGINSSKYTSSEIEGLNFAIPVNTVKKVASQIRQYGSYNGNVSFGITLANVSSLTKAGRTNYNVPDDVTSGTVVTAVTTGSSSDGILLVNDIIIKIDDTTVTTSDDISPIVASHVIGDKVSVTVIRSGVETVVEVTFKRTASS